MSLYVAEVYITTAGYMPINTKHVLASPTYFGVRRGYWRIALRPDRGGNDRPDGVAATFEFAAGGAEQAEDSAVEAAKQLSSFLAAYLGSPLRVPELLRLAKVGVSGGIVEQYNYYYEDNVAVWPRVPITPGDLVVQHPSIEGF